MVYGGSQRISAQAAQLVIGYNYFEASKAGDPFWSAKFWQWIEPTLGVLVPEIRTLGGARICGRRHDEPTA